MLDTIVDRGARVQANRRHRLVKQMFQFAVWSAASLKE
jgi:hypothetical protein